MTIESSNPNYAAPAHAVIANGMPAQEGTTYTVHIYDPNYSTSRNVELVIDASDSQWVGTIERYSSTRTPEDAPIDSYTIMRAKFEDSYSLFDSFDRDGEENIEVMAEEVFYDGKDILMICATGDFTIENAEGESFHYSQEQASRTMEVLGKNIILVSSELPCDLCFLVEESSDFTCIADESSEILSFSVIKGNTLKNETAEEVNSSASAES